MFQAKKFQDQSFKIWFRRSIFLCIEKLPHQSPFFYYYFHSLTHIKIDPTCIRTQKAY